MSRSNGGWPHLRLADMSDIELLQVFAEAAEEDGGATAIQTAEKTDEGVRAARAIGSRFGWMKRWGFMENEGKRWFLTAEGERLAAGGSLTVGQRNAIERAAADDRALGLGDVIGRSIPPASLKMLKRQIRHRELQA